MLGHLTRLEMDKPRPPPAPVPPPPPSTSTASTYSRGIFKPPRLPPQNRVPRFPRSLPDVGSTSTTPGGGTAGTLAVPPPKFILPPISTYLPRPPPPSTTPSAVDLSMISRAKLKLPDEGAGFVMSKGLQRDLLRGVTNEQPVTELLDRVYEEARSYAEKRKMLVRKQLKERLEEVGEKLSARERGKLRSRREAKVHRVKEQELEKALKSTIRWLIESAPRGDREPEGDGDVNSRPCTTGSSRSKDEETTAHMNNNSNNNNPTTTTTTTNNNNSMNVNRSEGDGPASNNATTS